MGLRLDPGETLEVDCVRAEVSIGDVTLPAAEGTRTVHLRGRIDRVDWTTDGRVRVVDYKTGAQVATASWASRLAWVCTAPLGTSVCPAV